MEIWKDIEGYEGLYQVSNLGRVKSLARTCKSKGNGIRDVTERIRKTTINNCGYVMVSLHKDKKIKNCAMHRLVANAFIDNPNNLPQINHKDGDKTNNQSDNLEWITSSDNNKHKFNELGYRPHNCKKIRRSDGLEFDSAAEAARYMNGYAGHLSQVCNGSRNKAYGYGWEYIGD